MENAFTVHGKAGAFPHPANAVSHSSMIQPVIHIPTAPTTANIHPFFPTWIKENKSIKNGEYSYHHTSGNCTPFLCLEKWRKSTLFPIILPYLSGREDRQQFQPGNSACSYGYIFCRSCCTAACRSPQERSSIPVSTFYFGS